MRNTQLAHPQPKRMSLYSLDSIMTLIEPIPKNIKAKINQFFERLQPFEKKQLFKSKKLKIASNANEKSKIELWTESISFVQKWRVEIIWIAHPKAFELIQALNNVDISSLTQLNLMQSSICSIQFLEWINTPNLTKLYLHKNTITSLKPLSKLSAKLKNLSLEFNPFDLIELTYLNRLQFNKFQPNILETQNEYPHDFHSVNKNNQTNDQENYFFDDQIQTIISVSISDNNHRDFSPEQRLAKTFLAHSSLVFSLQII